MKTLFNLLFAFTSMTCCFAQISSPNNFLWVKGGGTPFNNSNNQTVERAKYLAVDGNKNVYGMSVVKGGNIQIGGFNQATGYGVDDFVVFSLNCEGQVRWVKLFGGSANDAPGGLTIDAQDNIYICGQVIVNPSSTGHFADTTIMAGTMTKRTFIMKIDSSGNRLWFRMPGQNEMVGEGIGRPAELKIDNTGTLHMFTHFSDTPANWDGFSPTQKSWNVVKINSATGMVTGITKLQLGTSSKYDNTYKFFSMDQQQNYYLVSATTYDTLTLSSNLIVPDPLYPFRSFLIKFSNNGSVAWYHQINGKMSGSQPQDTSIDYLRSYAIPVGNEVFVPGAYFNACMAFGTYVSNSITSIYYPHSMFVAKLNATNGNGIFTKGLSNLIVVEGNVLSRLNNGNIAAVYTGGQINILNTNDTIKPTHGTNLAYPFVAVMDPNTGQFISGEAVKAGGLSYVSSAVSDGTASGLYFGGEFASKMYNDPNGTGVTTDSLQSQGGQSDFFVYRYALPGLCNCIAPQAQPQMVGLSNLALTVKASALPGTDSLVWQWGDGNTTKYLSPGSNLVHTYTTPGNYIVCLKAYSSCGVKDSCFSITATSVKEMELQELKVYPNPVTELLTVENPYGSHAEAVITDMKGAVVSRQTLTGWRNTMDMSRLSPGVYMLTIQLEDGRRTTRKIVKK